MPRKGALVKDSEAGIEAGQHAIGTTLLPGMPSKNRPVSDPDIF